MLWNTFEKDLENLDRYHNPNFEAGSGISDYDELHSAINKMRVELNNESRPQAFSKIVEFVLDNAAIEVNPIDWFGMNIAGWVPDRARHPYRVMQGVIRDWEYELYETNEESKKILYLRNLHEKCGAGWSYPDNDHSKPYWDDILPLGIKGLLDRVKFHRDEKIKNGEYTTEKQDYYESVIRVYEAFLRLLYRFADCAKKHIDDNEKMPFLYNALINIAENPPKNLYEVMVLTFIYTLIQEYVTGIQTRTLGNIDTLWRPYYEKALSDGSLTRDNVKELLKYFYMQYEMAGHPHAQPVFLAGTDGEGNDLVNDLSYTILEAYSEVNIISPKIQIAVSEKTPDEFVKKCCEMIRAGHTSIAFVNEELGRASQELFTDNKEDMKKLSLSGCYNFSLKENIQPESVGISFVKGIELALNNGIDPMSGEKLGTETGDIATFDTFEKFYNAYWTQTYKLIDDAIQISDFYDRHFIEMSPSPMLSANFEHSVKQGKDVYFNGSKYHNTVITISCLATAVDSLYAVKKYVYDNKRLSLSELNKALDADWKGYEELQSEIASDAEKYGNNIDCVDFFAKDLMEKSADKIMEYRTWLGEKYSPDGEGIDHGIRYGKRTGATPDGRNAGDQLSKNLQSVFGCDRRGVIAYINSVTKINAFKWPNGAPIDFVLHPSAVEGDGGLDVMTALVRTTFKKGGAAIQGNVYSAEILRDAQKNPDKYKGLQVRLCGWSQYFNKLSRDEQDMLIRQAETA